MDTIIVTLQYLDNQAKLELPNNVPVKILLPILAKKLKWQGFDVIHDESSFTLQSKTGILMRSNDTLKQLNIANGDTLELDDSGLLKTALDLPPISSGVSFLQCMATGQVFPIRGRAALIGRSPTMPIALNSLPNSDAVSRKHANLIRRRNDFWLKDEYSLNGTIVDGSMLRGGENVRLQHGSRIQFGKDGPTLIFHFGKLDF